MSNSAEIKARIDVVGYVTLIVYLVLAGFQDDEMLRLKILHFVMD